MTDRSEICQFHRQFFKIDHFVCLKLIKRCQRQLTDKVMLSVKITVGQMTPYAETYTCRSKGPVRQSVIFDEYRSKCYRSNCLSVKVLSVRIHRTASLFCCDVSDKEKKFNNQLKPNLSQKRSNLFRLVISDKGLCSSLFCHSIRDKEKSRFL